MNEKKAEPRVYFNGMLIEASTSTPTGQEVCPNYKEDACNKLCPHRGGGHPTRKDCKVKLANYQIKKNCPSCVEVTKEP